MHGVFDLIARNEDVSVNVGKSDFGNDKAVTVLMVNQAAADFIARSGFVLGKIVWRGRGDGWRGVLFLAAEKIAVVGKFFNQAAFFQAGEHLLENVSFALFDLEGARKFVDGDGVISKLKKT
jgi:hypothetical protein